MNSTEIQACQRETINDLRHLIVEHHSYDVMRCEHVQCPVCTKHKWDVVLNTAMKLGLAGAEQPAMPEVEGVKGVGISDLLGDVARLRKTLTKCLFALDEEALAADEWMREAEKCSAWFQIRAEARDVLKATSPNDQAHPTAAKATVDGTKNL